MTQPPITQPIVTRFAPSPTGRLHIGHAWSALMAMDMARATGGTMRLRIEDIDGTRSRAEHVTGIMEDLHWIGVMWDGDIVMQSQRIATYDAALTQLRDRGLIYPCFCTRADIQGSLSAPHGPAGPVYPGTCRTLPDDVRAARIAQGLPHAWRMNMGRAIAIAGTPSWRAIPFPPRPSDACAAVDADPAAHGDAVLARKDAPASYHLSCTLDDAAMGISHVLRGDDLRGATDIHRLLQALLNLPSLVYCHHPLLTDAAGRRLAKRDGAISLAELRAGGMAPDQLAADLRAGRFPVGIGLLSA